MISKINASLAKHHWKIAAVLVIGFAAFLIISNLYATRKKEHSVQLSGIPRACILKSLSESGEWPQGKAEIEACLTSTPSVVDWSSYQIDLIAVEAITRDERTRELAVYKYRVGDKTKQMRIERPASL